MTVWCSLLSNQTPVSLVIIIWNGNYGGAPAPAGVLSFPSHTGSRRGERKLALMTDMDQASWPGNTLMSLSSVTLQPNIFCINDPMINIQFSPVGSGGTFALKLLYSSAK